MKNLRFSLAILALLTASVSSSYALVFGGLNGPSSLIVGQNASYTLTVENQFTGAIPSSPATLIEIDLPDFTSFVSVGISSWYSWSYDLTDHKIVGTQIADIPAWNGVSAATYPTSAVTFTVAATGAGDGAISANGFGFAPYGGWESNMIFINGTPLPVTLVYFFARAEGTQAELTWTATRETNSHHFEIQHSINAKLWSPIGEVMAMGESRMNTHYTFMHSDPHAAMVNYYRLKMVDQDGTFAYSPIKSLVFRMPATSFIYPNPATGLITISTKNQEEIESVSIKDQRGIIVAGFSRPATSSFHIGHLSAGLYFVITRFSNNTGRIQQVTIRP